LQASTSEIYGDPIVHPQKENYRGNVNPIGIRACYDEGKRLAETLCFDYNREFGTEIKVVRIFNTYGPGMDPEDGRVISNFILQALRNKNITIYGDGKQTRSFCFVRDLIDGIIKMMECPMHIKGPVNLGNPNEFTINDLAKMILDKIASASKIEYYPLPSDDPLQRKPDIGLAKEVLGWEPRINLSDGLDKTIEYYRNI
jgi:UDP-glucuronate decarboxylase